MTASIGCRSDSFDTPGTECRRVPSIRRRYILVNRCFVTPLSINDSSSTSATYSCCSVLHYIKMHTYCTNIYASVPFHDPCQVFNNTQELSYRQQIARQLRTQYAEGIYGGGGKSRGDA